MKSMTSYGNRGAWKIYRDKNKSDKTVLLVKDLMKLEAKI